MDDQLKDFIDRYPDAAMITLRKDGTPHMARIEVAVVDGRLWSSGSRTLVRTRNLRRDPRCSLFVFGPHPHWVGLETEVTMLDGPDTPDLHVRLMQARHKHSAPDGMIIGHDTALGRDRAYSHDEYVEHIRDEQRLIYEFAVRRVYGSQ
jgi:PPOX class probable F420-dependent enzyme